MGCRGLRVQGVGQTIEAGVGHGGRHGGEHAGTRRGDIRIPGVRQQARGRRHLTASACRLVAERALKDAKRRADPFQPLTDAVDPLLQGSVRAELGKRRRQIVTGNADQFGRDIGVLAQTMRRRFPERSRDGRLRRAAGRSALLCQALTPAPTGQETPVPPSPQ